MSRGTALRIALAMMLGCAASGCDGDRTEVIEGAVGTAGFRHGDGDSGVIHEIETITGVNDGHQLVGRRVDLHVPVQQHLNDFAFWVGSRDNRVLVVHPGNPSISVTGTLATVSGTIRALPRDAEMHSWGLAESDRDELMQRRIYVRADAVAPHTP
jgi:hypothetical protein